MSVKWSLGLIPVDYSQWNSIKIEMVMVTVSFALKIVSFSTRYTFLPLPFLPLEHFVVERHKLLYRWLLTPQSEQTTTHAARPTFANHRPANTTTTPNKDLTMDDAAKYEEVTNYFKERMAQSKKIAAARGKEARIAAHAAKAASGATSWRQLKGLSLMAHEASHVGNRPFMFGFA